MVRPMLGDLELEQVQVVETDEDQLLVRHPVPVLEGDFLQDLGRRGARVSLAGVLTRPDVADSLADLRDAFYAGDPVAFVSDITQATLIDRVLIERMDVRELAGRPSAYEYFLTLRELTEAEPIEVTPVIIPPPPPPKVDQGRLTVTVVVEGDPAFDMDRVQVTVAGRTDEGDPGFRTQLSNRIRPDTWFEDPFPAGQFTATALVDDDKTPTGQHETLTGSEPVTVREGEEAHVTIVLRRGSKIGTVFVVTFHFDKAFVEPCERHVLHQVQQYAQEHPDERLLVVGHTDKVGSDEYNQALSERRGRATFAMLTAGSDRARSVAEWNGLRQARPTGTIATVKDTWGTREIQLMLQDLGRFQGNVGKDPELTDAAIRQFQRDHGLADDGVVGDATWPMLIDEYLAHDAVDLPPARLFENRNTSGCDSGALRWLGCGEQDPVDGRETAWRPNRRCELMFVKEHTMPCQVPRPVTLDQTPDGAGGGGWCLDDGTATAVDCFVVPWKDKCPTNAPGAGGPAPADRPWCRRPAEPGTFPVAGRITFEDGSPFAAGSYVLMAPDGEFLGGEVAVTGAERAGTPIASRSAADGSFTFPGPVPQKGPGTYVVSVDGPFLVRTRTQTLADVTGNATCFRLDGSAPADIVIVDRAVASVRPAVTGPDVVVVRKPHTNPARRQVVLRSTAAFTGTGTFTRSSDAVRFFDAAAGGTELTFDGVDNVFDAARLAAGVTLFAEGRTASAAPNDVTLTVALTVNGTPGLSTTHRLTSVELFLDLHASRTAAGAAPAALTDAQKIDPGRFVQVQDAGNHAGRAMLTVRQAAPAAFTGTLVLAPVGARTRLFGAADEVAAAGQAPLGTPVSLPNTGIPATGSSFWVEGVTASGALRDATVQLGIDGVEPDGDHVNLTVVLLSDLVATVPATPARTARLGNSPVPAHALTVGAGPVPPAAAFDTDPTVNPPLPLVEGSVAAGSPVALTVQVRPAGVPVRWQALRATGIAAASGGDDAPGVVALSANPVPTVTPDAGNPLAATMLADAVGTFHVRAFVDGNGNGGFDAGADREPAIVLPVVSGRATLFLDSSVARSTNFTVTPNGVGGITVTSGSFNVAAPATAAIHMNAQVDVVTGGANGRRVIDQFFGGWINNETAVENVVGTFQDAAGTVHSDPAVFASNTGAATGGTPASPIFLPGDPAPALIVPPLLDSGRGAGTVGIGGDSATLTRSRIRTRTNQALGERWIVESVDSPGDGEGPTHPGFAAATLRSFRFGLTFSSTLGIWTNRTAVSGATGDPADRAYGVVLQLAWTQGGQWTVTPATGAIAVVTAPTTTISGRVTTSPAVAASTTPVEVRFPASTDQIARDARA